MSDLTEYRYINRWDIDRHFNNDPAFALHTAVIHGELPRIRELLTYGYGINKLDDVQGTPDRYGTSLHVAIWSNQAAAFELLVIRGADLEILDEGSECRSKDTPIRLAVRLGRRDMFKRLWDAGVEHRKWQSDTAVRRSLIEIASFEGYADILQDLLARDQAWTQDERSKALYKACRGWHVDVVAALLVRCKFSAQELEHGMHFATTSLPCLVRSYISKEERLLTIQEDSARLARVLDLLLDAHARSQQVVEASSDSSKILNRLLRIVSISPLKINALRLLLEKGADPNVQDEIDGSTPLHFAVMIRRDVQRCNEEGVTLLLDHGARVDIPNKEGDTAVEVARKYGYGDITMAQKLIEHGKAEWKS